MEGRPHKLLESVADRLANEILNDYHMVQGLQLHLKKPHVAVPGVVESLGECSASLVASNVLTLLCSINTECTVKCRVVSSQALKSLDTGRKHRNWY